MPPTKHSILKTCFGYDTFRPGQETLIDKILSGQDVLGIMPTGAGKSLCYQIPAMLLPGITLVISPLISLMKDQVGSLIQSGVPATFINSSLNEEDYTDAVCDVRSGACKLLYIAPERLNAPLFLELVSELGIAMVTVDEAHCVSQWGHDFRPSYTSIADFIDCLPHRPVVTAFTATATDAVRQDIVALLDLHSPAVLVTGFDRENLYFDVRHPKHKQEELLNILTNHQNQSGIIYCATRKVVETLAETLCSRGYSAVPYHAGLSDEVRRKNQDAFIFDDAPIVVATNAFGMGIDKSNVSFVIHYNMPGDLESYYQEAGRAGRDGQPADCILLYSGQDVRTQQFFIDHATIPEVCTPEEADALRKASADRLRTMTFYCHTTDCLRAYMLHYFGEDAPPQCDHCSNCDHEFETKDITIDTQKILSCIYRTHERYGAKIVTDTLRGIDNARIKQLGFDTLSTFGIMQDTSTQRIRVMITHLTHAGYIKVIGDSYPILALGAKARSVLFEGETVMIKLPKERPPKSKQPEKVKEIKGQPIANPDLYERLRTLRKELSDEQHVPAYVIFSNATLASMCQVCPTDEASMLTVSGVGARKMEQYGQAFIDVIIDFQTK